MKIPHHYRLYASILVAICLIARPAAGGEKDKELAISEARADLAMALNEANSLQADLRNLFTDRMKQLEAQMSTAMEAARSAKAALAAACKADGGKVVDEHALKCISPPEEKKKP